MSQLAETVSDFKHCFIFQLCNHNECNYKYRWWFYTYYCFSTTTVLTLAASGLNQRSESDCGPELTLPSWWAEKRLCPVSRENCWKDRGIECESVDLNHTANEGLTLPMIDDDWNRGQHPMIVCFSKLFCFLKSTNLDGFFPIGWLT